MSKQQDSVGCSSNVTGTLLIIFVVLKLVGAIDWSWWWVLSPLWLPIAIVIGIFVFLGLLHLRAD